MADPIRPLRMATIFIAVWSILYCLVQLAIMGWQLKEVKDRQWEYENRQLPATGFIDGFQARFPGLYQIYTETPDRRKTNAMYVIVIVNIILTLLHLPLSILLLYGAWKLYRNCVWPWMATAFPVIIMATAYGVLWWSGDIFNEQLVMSVIEFVMSLAINGICLVVVIFFYARLRGNLQSTRPARRHHHRRAYMNASGEEIPPWRVEWNEQPPPMLKKKLTRQRRRSERERSKSPQKVYSIRKKGEPRFSNFAPPPQPGPASPLNVQVPPQQGWPMYFPYGTGGRVQPGYPYPIHPQEVYDAKSGYPCAKFPNHPRNVYEYSFPWNPPPEPESRKVKEDEDKPPSRAEAIKQLYKDRFPEEFSNKKSSMRSPFAARRRSPERVSFSRQGPMIHVRSPEETPSDKKSPPREPEKNSVV